MTGALLILAPLAPLLAGLAAFVAPARPAAILLVLSVLPGVAAGLTAAGAQTQLPGLLFGATLGLGPALAQGMAAVALLWGAAALHAMGAGGPAAEDGTAGARFRVCMGLAAAGQMGVFVAQDMATFYVAFAALSFAGYGLVRHKPTPEARRAARVYLFFVVIGELALFAALALINVGQNGLGLPVATGVAPPEAAWWLLAIGFGAKAGLVPLHVWLPLAHPVAPVPASAALSGGTLKAGLVGLLLFLPEGAAPPGFGAALMTAGFVGAFGAAVWGVLQTDAKVVLAYSSVSQMGLALAVTGAMTAGWTPPGAAAAALGLFVIHHAMAKGVLFLSVEPGVPRAAAMAMAGLCALSMIGAPLTPGYGVKQALAAAAPALSDLLSLSAWGTAALMARGLLLLGAKPGGGGAARGTALVVMAAALVIAPFAAGIDLGASLSSFASALPAAAVAVAAFALRATGWRAPTPPAGDLVALFEGLGALAMRLALAAGAAASGLRTAATAAAAAAATAIAAAAVTLADPGADDEQARWRIAGLTIVIAFASLTAAALVS